MSIAANPVNIGGFTKKSDYDLLYDGIVNTEFLPIGAIIMFDANNAGGGGSPTGESGAWVDDSTLSGWYACISGNAQYGCPNLVDKFIMGKVVAGAAATGGSNTIVDHTHSAGNQSVSHIHTLGNQSASHRHFVAVNEIYTQSLSDTNYLAVRNTIVHDDAYLLKGYTADCTVGKSGNQSASHIHTAGNQSANHTHTIGSGSAPGSTNSRPAYYSVIFIRKCA